MSEAEDGAEWLREIAREEIDAASISPEHVRLGAKVLGTAGVGLTALQLGAVGKVAAQETGPGAGTIGTEGSPLDAVYADTIDRDRDVIKPEELSIASDRFGLTDNVPLASGNARVGDDALEISADGAQWDPAQAEWYDGSAWGGAVVERFENGSWRQIYPETAIPNSVVVQRYATTWSQGDSVWSDDVGGADMSISGDPQESTLSDGADALDADGSDDVGLTTLPSEFEGSGLTEFSVEFVLEQTTTGRQRLYGIRNSDGGQRILITLNEDGFGNTDNGNIEAQIADDSGSLLRFVVDGGANLNDGIRHDISIVFEDVPNNSARIIIDEVEQPVAVTEQQSPSDWTTWDADLATWAFNDGGSISGYTNAELGADRWHDGAISSQTISDYSP